MSDFIIGVRMRTRLPDIGDRLAARLRPDALLEELARPADVARPVLQHSPCLANTPSMSAPPQPCRCNVDHLDLLISCNLCCCYLLQGKTARPAGQLMLPACLACLRKAEHLNLLANCNLCCANARQNTSTCWSSVTSSAAACQFVPKQSRTPQLAGQLQPLLLLLPSALILQLPKPTGSCLKKSSRYQPLEH